GHHNLLLINRSFGDYFAIWPANKTLAPKFDARAAGRRFVADAIWDRDIATICDRVTALNGFPRRILRFAKLLLLAWVPANSRRVENNFRAAQRSKRRRSGIPESATSNATLWRATHRHEYCVPEGAHRLPRISNL